MIQKLSIKTVPNTLPIRIEVRTRTLSDGAYNTSSSRFVLGIRFRNHRIGVLEKLVE